LKESVLSEAETICTAVQILKINPVESGISKASQEPYEWHTAECVLLDDGGSVSSVGRLVFSRTLRERLGGVPPIGAYKVVIELARLTGERAGDIGPQIIDLVPNAV
jgi:hypothetical protein